MSTVSIEVVRIGNIDSDIFTSALSLVNSEQSQFKFDEISHEQTGRLSLLAYRRALVSDLLDKLEKFRADILHARSLCDQCRKRLEEESCISPQQIKSLDKLFSLASDVLTRGINPPKIFIGSSSEGLVIAHKIKEILKDELAIDVWDEGSVFKLGDTTFEALEIAILHYQFGIFVFTPDDELLKRGKSEQVARDNVIFELGLFTGKLGRYKSFVIHPGKQAILLPSDLWGITTATYDPDEADLEIALRPACFQVVIAIRRALGYDYQKLR